jgi:hypothetical protein
MENDFSWEPNWISGSQEVLQGGGVRIPREGSQAVKIFAYSY